MVVRFWAISTLYDRQETAISRHLLKAAFDAKLAMAIPQTDSGPIR
jgi:hypothetical protein